MTTGEYGGIGSYIRCTPKGHYHSRSEAGSPGREGRGLRTGDLIIRIDTTDVKGWSDSRVRSLLQGVPGTALKVTVDRPYAGPDSIKTFDLVEGQDTDALCALLWPVDQSSRHRLSVGDLVYRQDGSGGEGSA